MGSDAEVFEARVAARRERDRRWAFLLSLTLVEDVGDGIGGNGAARERILERVVDGAGAVGVEQLEQSARACSERLVLERERVEEGVGVFAGGAQAVAAS